MLIVKNHENDILACDNNKKINITMEQHMHASKLHITLLTLLTINLFSYSNDDTSKPLPKEFLTICKQLQEDIGIADRDITFSMKPIPKEMGVKAYAIHNKNIVFDENWLTGLYNTQYGSRSYWYWCMYFMPYHRIDSHRFKQTALHELHHIKYNHCLSKQRYLMHSFKRNIAIVKKEHANTSGAIALLAALSGKHLKKPHALYGQMIALYSALFYFGYYANLGTLAYCNAINRAEKMEADLGAYYHQAKKSGLIFVENIGNTITTHPTTDDSLQYTTHLAHKLKHDSTIDESIIQSLKLKYLMEQFVSFKLVKEPSPLSMPKITDYNFWGAGYMITVDMPDEPVSSE
ncbi:MAG: hypothetical protein WD055_04465 [Candidatus Dependentiae bacterium]